jgi:hypothetical protein
MIMLVFAIVIATLAQPDVPLRIDSVFPDRGQSLVADPALIWFDDFDGPEKAYTESAGGLDERNGFGGTGGGNGLSVPQG